MEVPMTKDTVSKMNFDENNIFFGIIAFITAMFLWELYLSYRQHKVYLKHTQMPNELIGILSRETFDKARVYSLDKNAYSMLKDTISIACQVAFLGFDGLVMCWRIGGDMIETLGYDPGQNEILQSAAFMLVINIYNTLLSLPFSVYYTFVLEEEHGFNKQSVSFFIQDKIKAFVVGEIITAPLTCAIVYIVKIGGDYFFIYLWVFSGAMTLFLLTIYPDYIAPLFDKYTPLPDGDLRTEIEKLAQSIGFPLYKLYVVEGSKRSAHSNAYFYGFFKNKRIVLFDTLLKNYTPVNKKDEKGEEEVQEENKKGCDTNEVLAVLSHELGHWKLNHVLKNIIIMQVNLLLVFAVFGLLFKFRPMYHAFGFTNTYPVLIGLLILLQFIFSPYFAALSFLMAILSRRYEFQADRFAKQLGRSNYLKLALIKLNCDNLGFPIYDRVYSMWHHSHPPLLERLEALDKAE